MLLRLLATALTAGVISVGATAQVPFAVETYGPMCGPVATGSVTPNGATYRVAYTVTQAAPSQVVMLIIGINDQATPIHFGMPCMILTELTFTQLHRTDTTGSYTWARAMPAWYQGYYRVQFAEITFDASSNLTVRTSNGVRTIYSP